MSSELQTSIVGSLIKVCLSSSIAVQFPIGSSCRGFVTCKCENNSSFFQSPYELLNTRLPHFVSGFEATHGNDTDLGVLYQILPPPTQNHAGSATVIWSNEHALILR